MTKPVYDIQGKPIKVGSLVAVVWLGALDKARVTSIGEGYKSVGPIRALSLNGISVYDFWPHRCVVLEEPVWPNS